ncbi:hypothetical protein DUNSADRAFT_6291 [Dunaliella salina]|uniref:Encoded protein n=1 Tax=Dunaliella salina TaxID=3046 RepID=A0ABQ7GNK5_DUNSA|nr:hypothetical protein DUNSADRAFT_6291 [Dunaliella salina]|eukprot:KAF5836182.1 hypothetical protein DUNSADRAFT_6291 [Dunaliella salina]
MVSSHMGVYGKMGGGRGASVKHRASMNDVAVLELLSAPPPIISTSRARSSKLRPPRQDQMEANGDLPSETPSAPQPHGEVQPNMGSPLSPQLRRISSTPECTDPWNGSSLPRHAQHDRRELLDSGSPGYAQHNRVDLPDTGPPGHMQHLTGEMPDTGSPRRVQHEGGDLPEEGSPTCAPTSSHAVASHSNGSASAFAGASQSRAEGAEPQLARSPFQDHALQLGPTDGHNSDHSLLDSANDEEAHDGKKLGVIGESMSITKRRPSLPSKDAPYASDTSITRHGSIPGRLSERLSAMLPAFMQKPRPAQPCGNGNSSTQRHSRSHDLPKVEQSASSQGPLGMVDPPLSEPQLGNSRKNRRIRENVRTGSSSLGASQTHPLASFLNQSSEGLNSQAGNLKTLGDFRSSSPSLGSSGSATPPITTACTGTFFWPQALALPRSDLRCEPAGIINEGLGQLIQHQESQQQEAHARQQQVASRALRVKAARNRRSSLSTVSTRHSEGAAEEVQPRTNSVSNMLKGMQRKLRTN